MGNTSSYLTIDDYYNSNNIYKMDWIESITYSYFNNFKFTKFTYMIYNLSGSKLDGSISDNNEVKYLYDVFLSKATDKEKAVLIIDKIFNSEPKTNIYVKNNNGDLISDTYNRHVLRALYYNFYSDQNILTSSDKNYVKIYIEQKLNSQTLAINTTPINMPNEP